MLRLTMYTAEMLPGPTRPLPEVINDLAGKGYRPLFATALDSQANLLSVAPDALSKPTSRRFVMQSGQHIDTGEAFTDGHNIFMLTYEPTSSPQATIRRAGGRFKDVRADRTTLVRVACATVHDHPRAVGTFMEAVNNVLPADYHPHFYRSERFVQMAKEGQMLPPSRPTDKELAAAGVLRDPAARRLAIAIKSSGGLLRPDLEKQLDDHDKGRVGDLQNLLTETSIVQTDIVVICKRTQAQVNRVPSIEVLRRLGTEGLKCACGRNLSDERAEEAVSVSEFGQEMLNGSKWMTVVVTNELEKLGVPLEHILVEQTMGGDEMDCFADISGELALFELKDKIFSLGSAYSFGAKLGIAQPEHPIVVTTEHVGNDAKEHFERAAAAGQQASYGLQDRANPAANIVYIEGISNLRPRLEKLIEEVYIRDAARLLARIRDSAELQPDTILQHLAHRANEEEAAPNAPVDTRPFEDQIPDTVNPIVLRSETRDVR